MTQQDELFALSAEEAEQLVDMAELLDDPDIKRKWPHSLAGMADVAASVLRSEEDLGVERAERLALKVIVALSRYHGARQFYLPTSEALELALRDRRMHWRWMQGRATPEQLADETGLTYTRIMQILAEQRRLWRKRHEPGLPGLE
jgi:Mor family transcriptional regulator